MLAKPERKAHPVAELFPMMTDGEIDELAADIKANGQQVPIIVDADGLILDGRNRYEACRRAEVAPRLQKAATDEDPLALVISLNVKRRSLRAGQKAIAAAEAWDHVVPNVGDNRRAKIDRAALLAAMFGVSKSFVEMARALVLDDPIAAAAVKAGDEQLAPAHDRLAQRVGTERNRQHRLRQLRSDRPDLAEQVENGTITIESAEQSAKVEADERKQRRWATTMNVVEGVTMLDRPLDTVAAVLADYDPAHAESRGQTIIPARLRNAAAFANALADAMEQST